MSTELLTRRMDLIHTSASAINILKMDTSYPVKLSGIVVKIFQAMSNYTDLDPVTGDEFNNTTNLFFVKNQEDNIVVSIQKQNVFDFTGHKLKKDAFINGDYVLAIIDIDNAKIFIHSLENAYRENSVYDKNMDYICNGHNDNVILGGITNILIDLYDYSQNINIDRDEYNLNITNNQKNEIFKDGKFTINIIGNFGIDYSKTDFSYGGFNRQNRSTIMKISGTNNKRDSNIEYDYDKDMELILNWERCTIPSIRYDSNEKAAALYNLMRGEFDSNDNPIYYDYWTKEDIPHFVNNNGEAYGSLFPRRLVFTSIEGNLPLNITIKNMSLSTFGVGIYCEFESRKCIKIIDSKITIYNDAAFTSMGNVLSILSETNDDAETNESFYMSLPITAGVALDVNAYNPSIEVINCKFKNGSDNRWCNLVTNSCSNMRIINSFITDFYNMSDNYKFGYTHPYMDSEYSLIAQYYNTGKEVERSLPENFKNYSKNPNLLNSFIAFNCYYNMNANNASGGNIIFPSNILFPKEGSGFDTSTFNFFDIPKMNGNIVYNKNNDINSLSINLIIDYTNKKIKFNEICLSSRVSSSSEQCTYLGSIKNIPVLYRDNMSDSKYLGLKSFRSNYSTINEYDNTKSPIIDKTGNSSTGKGRFIQNRETAYTPKLYIDSCTIQASGILYQEGSDTFISNSKLQSRLFDIWYLPNPINVISGELSINNCDCVYDTRSTKFFDSKLGISNTGEISFIRMYPNVINTILNDTQSSVTDGDDVRNSIPWGMSVTPLTSSKLNIVSSKITLLPSLDFNIPRKACFGNKALLFKLDSYTSNYSEKYYIDDNASNKTILSFISTANNINAVKNNTNSNIDPLPLFNPLIAPNINIESSDFIISDTYSTSEFLPMYNQDADYNNLGVIIRVGNNIFDKLVTDSHITNINTSSYNPNNYNTYSNFINIIRVKYRDLSGYKFGDYYYDISTGDLHKYLKPINESDPIVHEVENYDISSKTTIIDKLKTLGWDTRYEAYLKLAKINNDTECIYDDQSKQIKYVKSDESTVDMLSENIENHIFICRLQGSNLAQTGYYLYDTIPDLLSNNIDDNEIKNRYLNFGVIAFKCENTVFNMNNCKIGAGTNYNAARNLYGMETLVRRSPRICFDFSNSGIYKINNTDANAWGTVLWSNLNKDASKIYDIFKSSRDTNTLRKWMDKLPLDSSTISLHNNGSCIITNCRFLNYNALRFKNNAEDWKQYLNNEITNEYKTIDSWINGKAISIKDVVEKESTYSPIYGNNSLNRMNFYNESVINANEMPIIFIANMDTVDTQINYTDIKGNESVIIQGNVSFNNCKYTNESNAIMCYVNNISGKSYPSLYVYNSKINMIKDVISDFYIDHDRRMDYYTGRAYEKNCSKTGMDKYNNVISVFYIESDNCYVELDKNDIVSICNSYNKEYGISINTKLRVLYFNKYNPYGSFTSKDILNFTNNKIVMLYDCPIFSNDTTYRSLPSSEFISVIETNQIDSNNNSYQLNGISKLINIKGNSFNVMTLLNQNENKYGIITAKGNINDKSLNSIPVFFNAAKYNVYTQKCIAKLKIKETIRPDNVKITEKIGEPEFKRNTTNIKMIIENNNPINKNTLFTPISIFSETKLINPFDPYSIDPNVTINSTFSGYIENDEFLIKFVDDPSNQYNNIISETTTQETITSGDYPGLWTYKETVIEKGMIEYIIDIHAKNSESSNDYNFVYTQFCTPILYSSGYYSININDNTIINSTIDDNSIYNIGNEEFQVLHSSTILDIYSKGQISSNEKINNFDHNSSLNINVNNNTFSTLYPKNILISTKNSATDDLLINVNDSDTTYNQYRLISDNGVKYFKYGIPYNGSNFYYKAYEKDNNGIYSFGTKHFIDSKTHLIKINNNMNLSHNIAIDNENVNNRYNNNYVFGQNSITPKTFTLYTENDIKARSRYIDCNPDATVSINVNKLIAYVNTPANNTDSRLFADFYGPIPTDKIEAYNKFVENFVDNREFSKDNDSNTDINSTRFKINILPILVYNKSNQIIINEDVNAHIYTSEYNYLKDYGIQVPSTIDRSLGLLKVSDHSSGGTLSGGDTFTIQDDAIYILKDIDVGLYFGYILIKFNNDKYYLSLTNLNQIFDAMYTTNKLTAFKCSPKSNNFDCGFLYKYNNNITSISNKYSLLEYNILTDEQKYSKCNYITLDGCIAKGSNVDTEPCYYFTYKDNSTSKVYRFSLNNVFIAPSNEIQYNTEILFDSTYNNPESYINNVLYQTYLLPAIQTGSISHMHFNANDTSIGSDSELEVLDDNNYYSELINHNIHINLNNKNNNYIYNNHKNKNISSVNKNNMLPILKEILSNIYNNIDKIE